MNRTLRIVLITFVSFAIYLSLDSLYFHPLRNWLDQSINQRGVSHIISYIISGIPIFIGLLMIHRNRNICTSLGLNRSLIKGLVFSLICTIPMFVGFALFLEFNSSITLNVILINVISAAFFEELYFRGFLFGQVFRWTRLGFVISILLGAVLFGMLHLSQGDAIGEWIGIFLITFMGAILFAWLYTEWNYNLWVPIFLHLLMNLSFELYSAGGNALGGVYLNIFRTMTIILAIVLTLQYKKRNNIKLAIDKHTYLLKEKDWSLSREDDHV
jgi:CAAX amino terminal protease family.